MGNMNPGNQLFKNIGERLKRLGSSWVDYCWSWFMVQSHLVAKHAQGLENSFQGSQ